MKCKLLLTVTTCLLLAQAASSQTTCVQLKNYDFFVGANRERWTENEIENLIKAKPKADDAGWLVPVILKQLSRYTPACGETEVDRRFTLLLKLYGLVQILPRLDEETVSLYDKLKLIDQDFQAQLKDDKGFDRFIYRLNDPPLTGKPITGPRAKPLASRDEDVVFGKLRFSNTKTGVVVTAFGKRGNVLWSRSLQGANPRQALKEAQLDTLAVEQTDFVVAAHVDVDGEKLSLYVRPNGRFMYYRKSS